MYNFSKWLFCSYSLVSYLGQLSFLERFFKEKILKSCLVKALWMNFYLVEVYISP